MNWMGARLECMYELMSFSISKKRLKTISWTFGCAESVDGCAELQNESGIRKVDHSERFGFASGSGCEEVWSQWSASGNSEFELEVEGVSKGGLLSLLLFRRSVRCV